PVHPHPARILRQRRPSHLVHPRRDVMIVGDTSPTGSAMPPRSLVVLAASLCAGALAALAYFQDSDLVLLREHLNHPFAFGALACLRMGCAAAGLRRRLLRALT